MCCPRRRNHWGQYNHKESCTRREWSRWGRTSATNQRVVWGFICLPHRRSSSLRLGRERRTGTSTGTTVVGWPPRVATFASTGDDLGASSRAAISSSAVGDFGTSGRTRRNDWGQEWQTGPSVGTVAESSRPLRAATSSGAIDNTSASSGARRCPRSRGGGRSECLRHRGQAGHTASSQVLALFEQRGVYGVVVPNRLKRAEVQQTLG